MQIVRSPSADIGLTTTQRKIPFHAKMSAPWSAASQRNISRQNKISPKIYKAVEQVGMSLNITPRKPTN